MNLLSNAKKFSQYKNSINKLLSSISQNQINQSIKLIEKTIIKNGTLYLVGNGGSASIASHISVDFTKIAKIKSSTFNNSNFITCFANDYGYENWVTEAIKAHCLKDDILILISSSGKSSNIINAAHYCKDNNIDLITLSGFNQDNDLSKLGKVNFYVNSQNYNYVEMAHHIILVSIVDFFKTNS